MCRGKPSRCTGCAGSFPAPRPKSPYPRAWLGAASGHEVGPDGRRLTPHRYKRGLATVSRGSATPRSHRYRGVARAAGLLMLIGSGGKPNRARYPDTTDRRSALYGYDLLIGSLRSHTSNSVRPRPGAWHPKAWLARHGLRCGVSPCAPG